jgi:hypothetical protein
MDNLNDNLSAIFNQSLDLTKSVEFGNLRQNDPENGGAP